ncbi:MAG: C25 family cysteine peptidase [Myxococcota bacterium]|nr:C25 family cysteine peptidase [Myxococcota bacterium]
MPTRWMRTASALFVCSLIFVPIRSSADTWLGKGKRGAAPVLRLVEKSAEKAFVEIEIPGVWSRVVQKNGIDFESLVVPGFDVIGPVGGPALPAVGFLLVLPEGRKIRVKERVSQREVLGEFTIAPFQERLCRCGSKRAIRFIVDPSAYAPNRIYPSEATIAMDSHGWMRDIRLARLVIRPLTYDTGSGQVILKSRIIVEVDIATRDAAAWSRRSFNRVTGGVRTVYGQAHLDLRGAQEKPGVPAPEHTLIIGPSSHLDEIQPLALWRTQQGTQVTITDVADAGRTPEEIKAFIQAAYDEWASPPTAVLFVGDETAVPPFDLGLTPYGDTLASDYVYSLLSGDDIYPDVMMGRLVAPVTSDTATQVDKIVGYETNPDTGAAAGWYDDALFMGSNEGYPSDEERIGELVEIFNTYGYTGIHTFFQSTGWDPADIKPVINAGVTWIAYMGHGSGTSWLTDPAFDIAAVNGLANDRRLPVIWDVACSNGQFQENTESFVEAWMNKSAGGAVAMLSATASAGWVPPAEWSKGIHRSFAEAGYFRFGEAALAGVAQMVATSGEAEAEDELKKYVLFGDPLLEIRSKPPVALDVDFAEVASIAGGPFQVTVATGGSGVAAARVAGAADGRVLASGLSDPEGRVVLDLPTLEALDAFTLTVTGRDAVPFQDEVAVSPPGCGAFALSNHGVVSCDQVLSISLIDEDLNQAPDTVEHVQIQLTVNDANIPLAHLTEKTADDVFFDGSVVFSSTPSNSEVDLQHGDTIALTYEDADCQGQAETVVARLTAQCAPPAISDVNVSDISWHSAVVNWTTNVRAGSLVAFGAASELTEVVASTALVTSHALQLEDLSASTVYKFKVTSVDEVQNSATDDNGGSLYEFETIPCPPDCEGRECGPDGCGATCGECDLGFKCDQASGLCKCPTFTTPGCEGCDCEACVFELDSYCEDIAWNITCVQICEASCGGCGFTDTDTGIDTDSGSDSDGQEVSDESAGDPGCACQAVGQTVSYRLLPTFFSAGY